MWKPLAAALIAATLLAPTQAQALENEELLALVAMPLAVAAVSEVADVPVSEIIDVVTLLNDAAVPPQQFIEVFRYVPVALVVDEGPNEPDFIEFVRTREHEGLRGTDLVNSIEERLLLYGLPEVELAVTRPRTIDVTDESFIPKVVRTRLAEARRHPHGGPPGQLKKQRGLQTGAEVVHAGDANDDVRKRVVTRVVDDKDVDGVRGKARRAERGNGNRAVRPRKVEPHTAVARRDDDRGGRGRGHAKGNHGGGKGKGNGNGKGKGKG